VGRAGATRRLCATEVFSRAVWARDGGGSVAGGRSCRHGEGSLFFSLVTLPFSLFPSPGSPFTQFPMTGERLEPLPTVSPPFAFPTWARLTVFPSPLSPPLVHQFPGQSALKNLLNAFDFFFFELGSRLQCNALPFHQTRLWPGAAPHSPPIRFPLRPAGYQ